MIYQLERKQILPISIEKAWDYFSSPHNLKEITPPDMGFEVKILPENQKMYAGMIISYTVRPMFSIPIGWVTEITHVHEPYYFVDEQRFGPYEMWHHQHWFKEISEGVEMTDLVSYKIPYGIFGRIADKLFVRKRLEDIFNFRYKTLEKVFESQKIVV
jgi:ligand-binding SRPBCC domain-containing protein